MEMYKLLLPVDFYESILEHRQRMIEAYPEFSDCPIDYFLNDYILKFCPRHASRPDSMEDK